MITSTGDIVGLQPYIVFGTSDPFRRMHNWCRFRARHPWVGDVY